VEDKGNLMTFHYREVDVAKREHLIRRAKELIQEAGYKVTKYVTS
jgi:trehalose-6-phosphatase